MLEMNKSGFMLGGFTLKIIVAIISLLLLVFLLFGLYSTFSKESNLAKAESTVDELIERVNVVAGDPSLEMNYIITGPIDWYLVYFLNGNPDQCFGKSCLCICDGDEVGNCNKLGVCKSVVNMRDFEAIQIDGPTEVLFNNVGGEVIVNE